MIRRVALITASILITAIAAGHAEAREMKMIFWYPGEAGSSQEGQPVIDAFLEYVNEKIAPDKIRGSYINTVEGGLSYIAKEKPQIGIFSFAAWAQNGERFANAKPILSTLPLPGKKKTESYELFAREEKLSPGAVIMASEPMSAGFVRSKLFEEIPEKASMVNTNQMIFKLKEIAGGKLDAAAILTPTEAASLGRMKTEWASKLKRIAKSKPVSTAQVILLDPSCDASRIKETLLSSGRDAKAREILAEMRLVGFSE